MKELNNMLGLMGYRVTRLPRYRGTRLMIIKIVVYQNNHLTKYFENMYRFLRLFSINNQKTFKMHDYGKKN